MAVTEWEVGRDAVGVMPPGVRNLELVMGLEPVDEPAPSLLDDLMLMLRAASTTKKLRSSMGLELLDPGMSATIKGLSEQTDSGFGRFVEDLEMSEATGCWIPAGKRPNAKGYIDMSPDDLARYGVAGIGHEHFGLGAHKLSIYLLNRAMGLEQLHPNIHRDHLCNCPRCANPKHLEAVSNQENNIRRRASAKLAGDLMIGQEILLPTYISWFDEVALNSSQNDTGVVVTTREGPRRIMVDGDDEVPVIAYGEVEPCEVFDNLAGSRYKGRPVSKQRMEKIMRGELPMLKPKQKSRARFPDVVDGQLMLA